MSGLKTLKTLKMRSKESQLIMDSRFVKVAAIKKDELKDSLVFVYMDEDKFGHLDKGVLKKFVKDLEKNAPDSCWFGMTRKHHVEIYNREDFEDKDLIIIVKFDDDSSIDKSAIIEQWKRAIPQAKSIDVVFEDTTIESW